MKKKKLYYTPKDGGGTEVVELNSIDADEALAMHPDQYKLAPNGVSRLKANESVRGRFSDDDAAVELGVAPKGKKGAKGAKGAPARDVSKRTGAPTEAPPAAIKSENDYSPGFE